MVSDNRKSYFSFSLYLLSLSNSMYVAYIWFKWLLHILYMHICQVRIAFLNRTFNKRYSIFSQTTYRNWIICFGEKKMFNVENTIMQIKLTIKFECSLGEVCICCNINFSNINWIAVLKILNKNLWTDVPKINLNYGKKIKWNYDEVM